MRQLIVSLAIFILSTISLTAQTLATQAEVDAWGTGRTEVSMGEPVTIEGNNIYVYTIVLENESETIQLSGDVTLLK